MAILTSHKKEIIPSGNVFFSIIVYMILFSIGLNTRLLFSSEEAIQAIQDETLDPQPIDFYYKLAQSQIPKDVILASIYLIEQYRGFEGENSGRFEEISNFIERNFEKNPAPEYKAFYCFALCKFSLKKRAHLEKECIQTAKQALSQDQFSIQLVSGHETSNHKAVESYILYFLARMSPSDTSFAISRLNAILDCDDRRSLPYIKKFLKILDQPDVKCQN